MSRNAFRLWSLVRGGDFLGMSGRYRLPYGDSDINTYW
jgi:hypothetical protein